MRVALVRLPYAGVYGVYRGLPRRREVRPPLGLLYVAAALEAVGHEVLVVDGEATGLPGDFGAFDAVGVTATTPEIGDAVRLCREVKRRRPRTLTVVGGPHVSAVKERYDGVDHVVVGEGELAMPAVLAGGMGPVVEFPDAADLDALPLPARHLVDPSRYWFAAPGRGLVRMDVALSARGCPYNCAFCFNRAREVRRRDPARVADELEAIAGRGTEFVMFLDDTLTLSRPHVAALCGEIVRRGLHRRLAFYGNARADRADRETLEALRAANFVELSMGVESGAQALLDGAGKGQRLEQVCGAYRRMKALGFATRGSFILGLPGETPETVRETAEFACSLPLDRASCNILTPYPGTEMWDRAVAGDGLRLVARNFADFRRWGKAVVETDGMPAADLEAAQRAFLTAFYSRPASLRWHARQLLRGNRSRFYYRPVLFALGERVRERR